MRWSIIVQIVVTVIDIIVATVDCAGYFGAKALIYSFTYAIKLELEFVALNQLVAISRLGVPGVMSIPPDSEFRLPNASTAAPVLPTMTVSNEKNDRASLQPNLDLSRPSSLGPRRKNIFPKDELDITQNSRE